MATHPNTVSALRDKCGEIAGLIDALQDQLRAATIELDHIDATLRMFDPDIELDEIRPKPLPPRHHAFKGQVTRSILAMLRSEGAMDAKAITIRPMAERELNAADKVLGEGDAQAHRGCTAELTGADVGAVGNDFRRAIAVVAGERVTRRAIKPPYGQLPPCGQGAA